MTTKKILKILLDRKQISKKEAEAIKTLKKSGFNVDINIVGIAARQKGNREFQQTGFKITIETQRII